MSEEIIYEKCDVTVTPTRFIAYGQTYPINGITSVKSLVEKPNRIKPIGLIILGLMIAGGFRVGYFIMAIGILWLIVQKPIYCVSLRTASGEVRAVSSPAREYIHDIIDAINMAIVHRG